MCNLYMCKSSLPSSRSKAGACARERERDTGCFIIVIDNNGADGMAFPSHKFDVRSANVSSSNLKFPPVIETAVVSGLIEGSE